MILPSPAGMSLTKLSLAGNILIIPGNGAVWFVTSRLGTGNSVNLFLQCYTEEEYQSFFAVV
jgi:hypothetical protein